MEDLAFESEAALERDHWWFQGRRALFARVLREEAVPGTARILEVGPGTGGNLRLLEELGYADVIAVEPHEQALAHCVARDGTTALVRGDARTLPFDDARFDVVLAADVLEHVDDDGAAAAELLRVLRPGGIALVTVPTFMSLWGRQDEIGQHERRYERGELRARLEGAGFVVRRLHHFNYLLFVPIWIVRTVLRRLGITVESETGLGTPAVNRVLRWVFHLDIRSAGFLRPPVGVSAFALVKRPDVLDDEITRRPPPSWLRELLAAPGEELEITDSGVVRFEPEQLTAASAVQQAQFDRYAHQYATNLDYPHTREYQGYLDAKIVEEVGPDDLGTIVELCAGRGESFQLFDGQFQRGVGVDISLSMLEAGRRRHLDDEVAFIQSDATDTPLTGGGFDHVFLLGGIHHVPDRVALFVEAARLLRPGGSMVFREPVDDFGPWRWMRNVIYRLSPALDAETESPLRRKDTERDLAAAGLELRTWKTSGFLGFCIFMNSDVLIVNRLFRFVPGIERIARAWIRLDEWCARRPWLRGRGLQVVGVAVKPPAS